MSFYKIKQYAIVLLTIVFFFNSYIAQAEKEKVIIGVGEWAPLVSQDLKHNGVVARIVTEAFALEGIEVEFKWAKWKRAYESVKSGKWDASPGWTKTAEREQEVLYGDDMFQQYQVFFHLKSTPFEWSSYDDLSGKKIGTVRGYFYGDSFEKAAKEKKIQIDVVSNEEINFKKLINGRIDLFPLNILTGYSIARKSLSPEQVKQLTFSENGLTEPKLSHMVFNKGEKGERMQKLFNSGLKKLKDSGKVAKYVEESRQGLYLK